TILREAPLMSVVKVPGLKDVFTDLSRVAKPGDVVLLSPACASFDPYDDYRHRGEHFREMVEQLRRDRHER
ncbi:MAG: UDP-N-acetylmuramoyl-L-alanine--D-glutamate ligase, partial [Actinomycetota bacterium]